MKGFVYLLIFLILALLVENIFKKWNIIEGLDCAPKENSLSYNNQAKAKSQQNEITALKLQILNLQPQISLNATQVKEHKKKIEKALQSIQGKAKAKEAELDKAADFSK